MYPSAKDPYYGTFVKNFYESLKAYNQDSNEKVVIEGRTKSKLKKIINYTVFYSTCFYKLLFKKYDIIYVHTITFPILPIRLVSSVKKLPLIFNVHGGDVIVHSKLSRFLKNLSRKLLPEAKLIVCPSEYFKEICLSEFKNVESENIYISPSGGVAPSFFIEHSSFSKGTIKLGYVSRIDPDKGWNIFVEAIRILRNRGYDIRGIIIGRGREEKALRNLINQNEDIEYLGPKSHSELPSYYSSFDCFIFPTMAFESLGLVGIEAMAAGTPVIASNIGEPSNYVKNGFNGYKFDVGDPYSLANSIEKYVSLTEDKKNTMSKNCVIYAEKYRSTEVAKELYKKILSVC